MTEAMLEAKSQAAANERQLQNDLATKEQRALLLEQQIISLQDQLSSQESAVHQAKALANSRKMLRQELQEST